MYVYNLYANVRDWHFTNLAWKCTKTYQKKYYRNNIDYPDLLTHDQIIPILPIPANEIYTHICFMTHLDLLSTVAMKMVPTITQMMITATPSTIIRITAHCGSASEAGGVATGFTGSGGGRREGRKEEDILLITKTLAVQILWSHTHSAEQIKLGEYM